MTNQAGTIRLAVIDTDSGFLTVLGKRLEGAGWEHRVLSSSVPADELVAMKLNALLVDITVLGPEGWDYLEKVCGAVPGLGVLVCTNQSTVAQRVRGLRMGADDWIGKPCHPEEVMARIEAVVRRRKRAVSREDVGPMVAGELEVRADQYQAFVSGQSIGLTRREFELLQLLVEAHGQVIEREDIYQKVWGYAMAHGDRSVDVFVRKLRQKLQRHSANWRYIHTHFGIGYRFDPEPIGASVSGAAPGSGRGRAGRSSRRSPWSRRPPPRPSNRPTGFGGRGPLHIAFTGSSPDRNATAAAEAEGSAQDGEGKRSQSRKASARPLVAARTARPVYAGRLEIRPADHAALVDGRPLTLTVRELQLLTELAQNAERVMTRDELYSRVWHRAYRKSDRSVDVYVGRLRTKLDRALPGRRFIHTHTGIGYRFSPDG